MTGVISDDVASPFDGLAWTHHRARHDSMCDVGGLECTRMDNEHWRTPPYWTRLLFIYSIVFLLSVLKVDYA